MAKEVFLTKVPNKLQETYSLLVESLIGGGKKQPIKRRVIGKTPLVWE